MVAEQVAEQEKDNDSHAANTIKSDEQQVETDKVLEEDKMWRYSICYLTNSFYLGCKYRRTLSCTITRYANY